MRCRNIVTKCDVEIINIPCIVIQAASLLKLTFVMELKDNSSLYLSKYKTHKSTITTKSMLRVHEQFQFTELAVGFVCLILMVTAITVAQDSNPLSYPQQRNGSRER